MNYLGIDYGTKRVGLSFADDLGVAVPIAPAIQKLPKERMDYIAQLISERNINAIVIGYPFHMDGSEGTRIGQVKAFMAQLKKLFNLPIHTIDERLTSFQAANESKQSKRKQTIQSRQQQRRSGKLDSQAATLILQDFLAENR